MLILLGKNAQSESESESEKYDTERKSKQAADGPTRLGTFNFSFFTIHLFYLRFSDATRPALESEINEREFS